MTGAPSDVGTVAATVGGSPLPVLLAVQALRPKRALLIHSASTRSKANAHSIGTLLTRRGADIAVEVRGPIDDSDFTLASAYWYALVAGETYETLHAVYLGGTGPMSRAAWTGVREGHRWYVDQMGRVRNDLGEHIAQAEPLTVRELAVCGGFEPHAGPVPGRYRDAVALARLNLHELTNGKTRRRSARNRSLTAWLKRGGVRSGERIEFAELPNTVGATFPAPAGAADEATWARRERDRARFVQGKWLEVIARRALALALGVHENNVAIDLEAERGGELFEIDVVGAHHERPVALSCGASPRPSPVKHAELAQRARLLLGRSTRAAVVSLEPGGHSVRNSRITLGEAPVDVFGRESVARWIRNDVSDLEAFVREPLAPEDS